MDGNSLEGEKNPGLPVEGERMKAGEMKTCERAADAVVPISGCRNRTVRVGMTITATPRKGKEILSF
jgi:hypothetical protein